MIKFGDSGHPVFRTMSPVSQGALKSKGSGKLSIHFCADGYTFETVIFTIISVNQLTIYGAVSDLCEKHSACQTRTERPVLAGQYDPLFQPAKIIDNVLEIKCFLPAVVNSLCGLRSCPLVWHVHGVCLLHGHVAHSSHTAEELRFSICV